MYKNIIDEVYRLSQEEGMSDSQIAEMLECSRITVHRIRKQNNIPTANKDNIRDKFYICVKCHKKVMIRRSDKRKLYCEECFKNKTF
jgi:predicted transcriptional regulator